MGCGCLLWGPHSAHYDGCRPAVTRAPQGQRTRPGHPPETPYLTQALAQRHPETSAILSAPRGDPLWHGEPRPLRPCLPVMSGTEHLSWLHRWTKDNRDNSGTGACVGPTSWTLGQALPMCYLECPEKATAVKIARTP